MNRSQQQTYIAHCRHPEIQALRPQAEAADTELWIPTCAELQTLLAQRLPSPERTVFQQTPDGWVYETYLSEWAADYGTYIDAHRRFIAPDAESVLLQALLAVLGIGERWMV